MKILTPMRRKKKTIVRRISSKVVTAQMIRHLYFFQTMNLNEFHGEVSQKKEVAGRL